MVIGGGPAGMEAALVAALRGHSVTLYEKEGELGGQLRAASNPPFKSALRTLVEYLSTQLNKLQVKIETKKEVTPELIDRVKPEVVIVATGAIPLIPPLPGFDDKKVITAMELHLGKKKVGNKVLVAGGGLTGCDTALSMAQEDKKVTVVEMLSEVASDLNGISRMALLELLAKNGVTILTETIIKEFSAKGAVVTDKGGNLRTLEADTIVLAMGVKSENKLLNKIKDKVREVYVIGDGLSPRKVGEAMHEGFVSGWKI